MILRDSKQMISRALQGLASTVLLVIACDVIALNFIPDASQSQWLASGDKFECQLVQSIPVFGEAVFSRRAGHVSTFQLNSFESPDIDSSVHLIAKNPNWKSNTLDIPIAKLQASRSTVPLSFESPLTEQVLAQLQAGKLAVFSEWQWYPNDTEVNVGLSSANFLPAYREYQQCVTNLFHLSYDELRVTDIVFAPGSAKVPNAFKNRLKQVADLIIADPSIQHCHVAAFTDEASSSRANLELSWRRSEAVEEYLIGLGVSADMITTSYYGEANRTRSSDDSTDSALNRKVTVRIDRK